MDISVNASADKFELNLGACRASLNSSQVTALKDELTEVLLNALYEQPNYWQDLTTKLEKLKSVLANLFELDNEQLMHVIKASHQPHWLALVRFTKKEQPELAKRLLKAIGQIQSLIFTSLEEFTNQLNTEPASSIAEVVIALEALQPLIQALNPTPLDEKTETTNPLASNSSFNARATTFLTNLSELPRSNLRLILKGLAGKELVLVFSACRMLEITSFFSQLQSILPEKNYQQLESKSQARVDEAELRSLLAKLNQALKDLKKLLNNRKK